MNYVWVQSKASFWGVVLSFGITVTRLLMAVLVFFTLLAGGDRSSYFPIYATIAIIFMDHIDGKLFEKTILNQVEAWKNGRRVFDSFCDRLCIQLFCIPILIQQPKFVFIYIIVLSKEILTSIYCIRAYINNIVLSSNTAGKISCIFIGVAVILWLLHLCIIVYFITPIIIITGCISFGKYRKSYKMYVNNTDN